MRIEEEEKKFEDKRYLKQYFTKIRGQIQRDIENIESYFPANIDLEKDSTK